MKNKTTKKKIAFFISHPIQYYAPLFRLLNKSEKIDLTVYYFSGETLNSYKDKQLGKVISWDTDLTSEYTYKVLTNNSLRPSIYNGFFGVVNFEIIREVREGGYDYIISHGWNYASHWLVFITSFFYKIPVILRGEMPLKQEYLKSKVKIFFKKIVLTILFKKIHGFLSIGSQNKDFYKYYGVQNERIYFAPYAIDNKFFRENYLKLKQKKDSIRVKGKFDKFDKIVLFVGKFISKKNPMDLVKAFHGVNNLKYCLIFVGDGEDRDRMEDYILKNNIANIFISGFKNQSELGEYYTIADLFVLPSGLGETWGLVLNEAMNYNLPILVSDTVGSSDDLIQKNGFAFKEGDIKDLSEKIKYMLSVEDLSGMGRNSYNIVKKYSFENIESAILKIIDKN
jgi:glycosyltransferase involved in cell wall biosynthesis